MSLIKKMSDAYKRYLFDESRLMGKADYIAFPSCEQEIIEVLRFCREQRVPLTPQGSLTGLSGAGSPERGLVLNLSRMDRILGMRRGADGAVYVRVQPGLPLVKLRGALEKKSFDISDWSEESIETLRSVKAGELFFSPDPTEPTASLGGMASCNACGARSFLYGATRRHVSALRVVLADGRTARLARGGVRANGRHVRLPLEDGSVLECDLPSFDTPPVKDAGFFIQQDVELIDLFMGSQGTLGIISELELKLMPAPTHLWGVTAFLPDDEAALAYVWALKGLARGGVPALSRRPAAIEFFGKSALDMVEAQKAETPVYRQLQELPENYCSAVYAEFNDPDTGRMLPTLRELADLLPRVGGDPARTWVARDKEELEKLLIFRHAVPETIDLIVEKNKKNEPCITILSTDMSVDDEHFDELFHTYKRELVASRLPWIIFGHIGENHVHPNILARTKQEYEDGLALFEHWAEVVRDMGGTITAEHGVGKIKKQLELILYGPARMKELALFKRQFDSEGLLSPGNIITEVNT